MFCWGGRFERPLSSLAVVVRPPRVVASSAACSPRVVGYQPLAQQPPTSSLRPPPPPALFSCSSHRPPPALATANRHCRLTAPIHCSDPRASSSAACSPTRHLTSAACSNHCCRGLRREGGGCRRRAPCSKDRIGESPFDDDGIPSSSASARGGRWRRPSSSPLTPTSFSSSSTRRRPSPSPPLLGTEAPTIGV